MQNPHCALLLKQLARFATETAKSTTNVSSMATPTITTQLPSHLIKTALKLMVPNIGAGVALLRLPAAAGTRGYATQLAARAGRRAAAVDAVGSSLTSESVIAAQPRALQGMLLAAGVLSKRAGSTAAVVRHGCTKLEGRVHRRIVAHNTGPGSNQWSLSSLVSPFLCPYRSQLLTPRA